MATGQAKRTADEHPAGGETGGKSQGGAVSEKPQDQPQEGTVAYMEEAAGPAAGEFQSWKAPFHVRYRLFAIAGVIASAAWIWVVDEYVESVLGWNNLSQLLPHEVGGLAAGVLTPLALLWMVIAFWERGRSLRRDTEVLGWHMRQLIYPTERAETRFAK